MRIPGGEGASITSEDGSALNGRPSFLTLDPEKIVGTVVSLSNRIEERFPNSGLGRVCRQLLAIAHQAKARAVWIATPIVGLRIGAGLLAVIIVAGLVGTFIQLPMPHQKVEFAQSIQLLESGINDVVFIAVAIFFLITLETRIKRHRALKALHELRVIAHIIDMHQLTKDPERMFSSGAQTPSSPRRRAMTPFEMSRYLDYCSEMLSLTGKVAALYIQDFDDAIALASVNEIESLTTGLSRKIWQKLMVLNASPKP